MCKRGGRLDEEAVRRGTTSLGYLPPGGDSRGRSSGLGTRPSGMNQCD